MIDEKLKLKIDRIRKQGEVLKDTFPIYVADVNYVIEQLQRELGIAEAELSAVDRYEGPDLNG